MLYLFCDCNIEACGGDGIYTTHSQGIRFYNCTSEGNAGYGVNLDTSTLSTIVSNVWHEGNGNNNIMRINPGWHPSGAGGIMIESGNFPKGGIHIIKALHTSIIHPSASKIIIDPDARMTTVVNVPHFCNVIDNGEHTVMLGPATFDKFYVKASLSGLTGASYKTFEIRNSAVRVGFGSYNAAIIPNNEIPRSEYDIPAGSWVIKTNVSAGGSPGWVCINRQDTKMRNQAKASYSSIEVTSTNNMSSGDAISVAMDGGGWHSTTILKIKDSHTLLITDHIPSGKTASAGNNVYTNRWNAMANIIPLEGF